MPTHAPPFAKSDTVAASSAGGVPHLVMTLDAYCRAYGQPFHSVSDWREALYLQEPVIGGSQGRREAVALERPAMFAGRMRGVDLLPPNGYARTDDGLLIYQGLGVRDYAPLDEMGRLGLGIDKEGRFMLSPAPAAATVGKPCIYFGGHHNFGHFIFQNLMRLAAVERIAELRDLPLAVHAGLPARYLEFLTLLGYPESRRIEIAPNEPTRFSDVWMLALPLRKGPRQETRIWPEAVWWMKAAAARAVAPCPGRRLRIFIPRRNVQWRRLVNRGEVEAVLGKYQIETIDFATLSARDQIATASAAELIVSECGAGNVVTIFAPIDCVQIELSAQPLVAFFATRGFAAVTGQPYERIEGRSVSPDEVAAAGLPPNPSTNAIDVDYAIDCAKLTEAVEAGLRYCKRKRPA